MDYLKIIADAGATGTQWRIGTPEGEILERKTGGLNLSVNRAVLGKEAGIASILGTGSIAAAFSDVLRERVEAAGYGISAIVASPADRLCGYHFG